jgi:hypothetical protein
MSKWTYRILMALLACNIVIGGYVLVKYTPPTPLCLNGIVMVPDKSGDMWVQKGLWATHCIPVDKD